MEARDAVWLDVLPSMKNFSSELAKGAGKAAEDEGKKTGTKYGKALLAGVAVVAGGAALATKALYSIGATFDDMTDTIRVGTGATGSALDELVSSAKNVGRNVPAEFGDIGNAVADLNTRLGLTGEPLEHMSTQFLELTRIAGGDLQTNIAKGTRVFGDWQISTEDQSEALDHLFKVSQATGIGFDTLSDKAVQFGAPMRQLGFSFEETTALIGSFEREGVNSEKVMAGMQQSLGRMAKAGKDPQKEFRRLTEDIKNAGSAGEANAIAVELFGTRAGPDMAAAIREGRFEVEDLMASIDASGETILGAADDTMDFSEQWQMFKNEVMVAVAPAAERLFSVISDGMEWIRTTGIPTLKDFGGWVKDNRTWLTALAVTVGVAVVAFGTMTILRSVSTWLKAARAAVIAFNAALRANPIGLIITAIGLLVTALIFLYQNNETARKIIDAAWAGIRAGIDAVVNWFRNTAVPWVTNALDTMKSGFGTARDFVVGAWDKIREGIKSGWDKISGIFGNLKDGLNSVRDRFRTIRDAIGDIWYGVLSKISGPVRSVIEFFNDKFLKPLENALNKIPGVNITMPTIPVPSLPKRGGGEGGPSTGGHFAMGGVLPGYSPGHDNLHFYSPDHGWLHLSGGEPVMRPEFGAAVGHDWIHRMNQVARTGGVNAVRRELGAFSGGGVVSANRGQIGGNVGDALAGAGRFVWDIFTNPKKALTGLVDRLLGKIGGSWPAKVASGVAKSTVGNMVSWIKDQLFGGDDPEMGGRAVGSLGGWRGIWNLVKGLFPDARKTSDVRNSTVAGYGGKSLHASGRAIDFVLNPWSRMVEATKVLSQIMGWTELIHTPAGMWQQSFGKPFANFLPITKQMHYDHVHAGLSLGGILPGLFEKAFVADSGVTLGAGLNLINNRTGGPEPLGRLDQPMPLRREDLDYLADQIREGFVDAAERATYLEDRLTTARGI